MNKRKRKLTVQEAGALGGSATVALYGKKHYSDAGKKGAARRAELMAAGRAALARERDNE